MKSTYVFLLLVCVGFGVWAGCALDQVTPNAPADTDVLTTAAGIKAIAVGIQGQYGETINETLEASGFAAKQFATMPASVLGLREIETGRGDVQPFNGTVNAFWSQHYRVVKSAEDLINNVPKVPIAEPGTRSGILALARLMKAMTLGELIEVYEQIPVDVTASQSPTFVNRQTALNTVISLLETARDEIAATPPSTEFNTTILGTGFSLPNTIQAMIARYTLIQGDYAKALTAANAVNLTATSSIFYNSTTTRNPFYINAIQLLYYKPVRSFRLNADTLASGQRDGRVAFWVTAGTGNSFLGTPVDEFAQYRTDASRYYVYLPGEITLIKAECEARLNNLSNALTHVNAVRTKTTDAVGIGARLLAKTAQELPTQAAMLDEIYKQRYYELFITGLRWGDSRRFGKAGPNDPSPTRTRNWFPYPDAERLSNPNTPADPPL